jgi:hypothetical protein
VQATQWRRGKRATAVEIAMQAAAVMTSAMAVRAVAGRDKEIGGGGKEGVLTSFSWGCAQMLPYFALAGEAR